MNRQYMISIAQYREQREWNTGILEEWVTIKNLTPNIPLFQPSNLPVSIFPIFPTVDIKSPN